MKKFAFPDTSIFLHFQPLDQLDLAQLLECDEVELVIAPVIMEELERQGWDHPQLAARKRAQYSLRKVRSWMQTNQGLIREGVELTLCQGPKQTTFQEHRLDSRNRDDLLIANVLEYRRIHGDEGVLLLTSDARRQLKAHRHRLHTASLPPEMLLPTSKPAPGEEVAEARPSVDRAPGLAPRVELRFDNGSRMLDVRLKEEDLLPADMVAARLDELRLWCQEPLRFRDIQPMPGLDEREALAMLSNAMLIPEEEFERYQHEVGVFLEATERWLKQREEAMDSLRRTVCLNFEMVNSGGTVAEGLVLNLTLPKKLRWQEVLDEGEVPQRPVRPVPPRTHLEIVRESLDELYQATVPPWTAGFVPDDSPIGDDWLVEGQELRGLVDACPHQRAVKLRPVYAVFVDPGEISNFTISYLINQRNVPEPVDGRLLVRVG